ncbi:MAG: S-methyl-5-thioribose-1-phosphate isomerase [Candidatus Cloacimonetes bacterium]|nr:S-methyl-5-thioribose-1-phosphate isomerase [Candidatus Cloacimonadota bacterium]
MQIEGRNYRTVWEENKRLFIINQNDLPFKFSIIELKNISEIIAAIKEMKVRGAPAIGATAALAYAITVEKSPELEATIYSALLAARPTAVDLHNSLKIVQTAFLINHNPLQALTAARDFVERSVAECQAIGKYGEALLKNGSRILTHCNAGALATVDYGTALAPIRFAHSNGKKVFVYVDETRPRLQGARLTAWELAEEGIPHAIIADNAAGYFLRKGDIDLVITGADRIACNGDTANKIGTYTKAVLAHENGVPFYIAAPWSTFDRNLANGSLIPIEERDSLEVLSINGIKLTSGKSPAFNPAFDVTPIRYITGFITPAGIISRKEFARIWEMNI